MSSSTKTTRASLGFLSLQLAISGFALLVAAHLGCKPEPASRTESLEAITSEAGMPVTAASCGLPNQALLPGHIAALAPLVVAPDIATQQVVLSTLAAAPSRLIFNVLALGGRLRARTDATGFCASALSDGERILAGKNAAPTACWREVSPGVVDIIVPTSETEIRRGLLRALAYANVQYVIPRIRPSAPPAVWDTALKDFRKATTKLAEAFLKDIEMSPAFPRLSAFASSDPANFSSYVYAEAIDQYFCSPALKAAFEKKFPQTWTAFVGKNAPNGLLGQLGR